MCLNHIYIKNPKYDAAPDKIVFRGREYYNFDHDKIDVDNIRLKSHVTHGKTYEKLYYRGYSYLRVPCGHCPECASLKQAYLSQRVQLLSTDHYVFFQTLTIQDKFMKYKDVNGYRHRYFDITYFQNYVKYLRKYNTFHADFKYMAVTEYGGTYHRPHMHILYFIPKETPYYKELVRNCVDATSRNNVIREYASRMFWTLLKLWRHNSGSTKFPVWEPYTRFVSRNGRRNYDFQYINEHVHGNNSMNVTHYVTKYVLKFDDWVVKKQQALHLNLEQEEYKRIWQYLKPRLLISKHFGDNSKYFKDYVAPSFDYTLKQLDKSRDDNELRYYFINIYTKQVVPMAPYIRDKFMFNELREELFELSDEQVKDDPDVYRMERLKRLERWNKVFMMCRAKNRDDFFEVL